jgi:hypothetical protein
MDKCDEPTKASLRTWFTGTSSIISHMLLSLTAPFSTLIDMNHALCFIYRMAEVKRRTTVGEETVGGTRLKVTFSDLETTRTAWSTNVSLEEIGR